MKTIVFDLPKKVRKKIALEDTKLPLNRAPSVLGLVKDYAVENKMAIPVGINIIDVKGEEEITERFTLKEGNSSNLLLLLREALYSERYSEFPTKVKEEYLQEVEHDLNVPIEHPNLQDEPTMEQSEAAFSTELNKKQAFKKFKMSNMQIFIFVDTLAAAAFFAYLGYLRFALGVFVLSLIINSSYVILKQKDYPETQFEGAEVKKWDNDSKNEPFSFDNKKTDDKVKIIGSGKSPKTAQRKELEASMPVVTPSQEPTMSEPQSFTPDEDWEEKEVKFSTTQVQEQEVPEQLQSTVGSVSIPPADDFPSQNEKAPAVANLNAQAPQNEPEAPKRQPNTFKTEGATVEPEQNLPVVDWTSGAFPTLKAGNAETNHLHNLERLDQQIGQLIEKEFKVIQEKQAFVDQLDVKNHSDAMKARVTIEEVYQLQSAFEKKWTVA